jgi:hypothetical protein
MYNKVWVGGTKKVRRPQAKSASEPSRTLTCDLDLRPGQMTCDATGLGNPDRRQIWILNAGSWILTRF